MPSAENIIQFGKTLGLVEIGGEWVQYSAHQNNAYVIDSDGAYNLGDIQDVCRRLLRVKEEGDMRVQIPHGEDFLRTLIDAGSPRVETRIESTHQLPESTDDNRSTRYNNQSSSRYPGSAHGYSGQAYTGGYQTHLQDGEEADTGEVYEELGVAPIADII
jgi:hypothetical protein